MINNINKFFIFFIIILPLSLITGPAIPDLSVVIGGIFFLFYFYIKDKYKIILQDSLVKFSIFFWLFLLFISFFAENTYLAFRDSIIFIRYLLLPIFLIYLVYNNINLLKFTLALIFLLVIFICLDCILQFINYDPENGFGKDIFGFKPNWYGRLTGPFYQELIPGAYISKFGLLGLVYIFIFFKNKIYENIVSIIYLILIGVVTYISGERMAFATFLLGIFFLLIFFPNKRIIFLMSLILIFIFNFLINKNHPFYNDFIILESKPSHLGLKIEKEFICKNNNNKTCNKIIYLQPEFYKVLTNFNQSPYGQIYQVGIKIFNDHKILGIGMNNFTHVCRNDERYNKNIDKYNYCVTHPHNIYLQWLIETGIFGLLFFLIYLYNIIKYIFLNNFNKFSLISLSTLLILFWPIMSTGSLLKNWNGISTFFIIGLCLCLSKLRKEN
tara:strand:- start:1883 stop:3208 length:1326 start_codon:yes stop_codon:yes gene_type:complete